MSPIQIHYHMDHSSFNESFLIIKSYLVFCARYSAKLFIKMTSFNPVNNFMGKSYCPHLTDEETKAQKEEGSSLNSHSNWWGQHMSPFLQFHAH